MIQANEPTETAFSSKKKRRAIPDFLVREVVGGIPFYYSAYRSILNQKKEQPWFRIETAIHLFLKNAIADCLKTHVDDKRFYTFMSCGNRLNDRYVFCLDIAIFDKKVLVPQKITTELIDVPAKIVIEIDLNVELGPDASGNLFEQYMVPKIQQLFAFGTERVIWVFTKTQTIIFATAAEQWSFPKWDSDLEIMPGVLVNIARLIEEEGISLEIKP